MRDHISIGEWCFFSRREYDNIFSETEDVGLNLNLLLGMVLGLTYLDGQTFKQREFSKTCANVRTHPKKDPQRGVGVLCSLYTCDLNGLVTSVPQDKHTFINIESYVATIKPPNYVNQSLNLSTKLVDLLTELA